LASNPLLSAVDIHAVYIYLQRRWNISLMLLSMALESIPCALLRVNFAWCCHLGRNRFVETGFGFCLETGLGFVAQIKRTVY